MSKQGRIRTQAMRAAQAEEARRRQRRQRLLLAIGGAVALGLVVAIAVVLVRAATTDDPATAGSGDPPANLTSDGAVPVGDEAAPVTMEIYFDYMCPACGAFEEANGAELDELVEAGDVYVALRPMSFLDRTSEGTEYSTRTANALATVVDGAPDAVWAFHEALYANQPEEGTTGLTDDEIADIALEAGVPQDVVDRFEDREFDGWVAEVTQDAFDSGVEGTPTVRIDGETFEGDLYTPGPLGEAVRAAAGSTE